MLPDSKQEFASKPFWDDFFVETNKKVSVCMDVVCV